MGVTNGLKAMGDEVMAVDGWPKILPSVPYSLELADADYNWASVEELDFFCPDCPCRDCKQLRVLVLLQNP